MPPVVCSTFPPQQPLLFHPIDQFPNTVVAQLHAFCQRTDRGLLIGRQPAKLQQSNILLGFDACGRGHLIRIVQETSDQEADLGDCSVPG